MTNSKKGENVVKQLIAGAGSGVVTKTATAPIERAKILLQVQGINISKEGKKPTYRYKGLIGTMSRIVRDDGLIALYRGNGANVLRVIPVYALKFTFNDFFRDILKENKNDTTEKLSFGKLILSGTMAGLFQTSITYPLETVRTRLSMGTQLGAMYNGINDALVKTVRDEGFRGLYKGIGPTFLTGSPYVGVQMTGFELLQRNKSLVLEKLDESKAPILHGMVETSYLLLSGALAGVTAQTLTYPGDTVRRRMQTNGMLGRPKVYSNSWDCFGKIIRLEGPTKLYAGLSANLVRAIPGAALQFTVYDKLKRLLHVT